MAKVRVVAALVLAALVAFGPAAADARAGGSYGFGGGGSFLSQGSRGLRTYNSPMQQSLTPRPSPQSGSPLGYSNYHPFWSGLAGGFFGSWLGSMLFPHWGYGYGSGSLLGSIFWLFVILWLGRMLFRTVLGRTAATYAGGGSLAYGGLGLAPAALSAPPQGAPLAVAGADYGAFETILKQVQQAWSSGDLNALRHLATPEMVSYFAATLAENESRGVRNRVEQVELLKGDLREAWDEGHLQYATCSLRWRALDSTVRLDRQPSDPDYVVDGDPLRPTEAAETWTFARTPGGRWLLSAIQQV